MKKIILHPFTIYAMSKLVEDGYKIGGLRNNRNLNENDIKKKIKSLSQTKGTLTPGLVVSARQCIEEGLEVIDDNGNLLTAETPNLDLYLILIDGQHRREAIRRINAKATSTYHEALSKAKTNEEKESALQTYKDSRVELFVTLPLNNEITVMNLLEEVNSVTRSWSGSDFLTKILNSTYGEDIQLEPLIWIKEHMGSCSETAAKLWATLDHSKNFSKSQLIKASANIVKLKELTDISDHKFGVSIYEAALKSLGTDIVKRKCVAEWVISLIKNLSIDMSKTEASKLIVKFFAEMTAEQGGNIKTAKKTEKETKDQAIKQALTKAWQTFIDSNSESSTTE